MLRGKSFGGKKSALTRERGENARTSRPPGLVMLCQAESPLVSQQRHPGEDPRTEQLGCNTALRHHTEAAETLHCS